MTNFFCFQDELEVIISIKIQAEMHPDNSIFRTCDFEESRKPKK